MAGQWIYLSPHLDDVVFSCGGLIHEQVGKGLRVEVWTICAGDPPAGRLTDFARMLHSRWRAGPQAAQVRREEDRTACASLGAAACHWDVPDCIYRRFPDTGAAVIRSEKDLFQPLQPGEAGLVSDLTKRLEVAVSPQATLVVPLAVGGHVDHRLVRAAAEGMARKLWYYPDYPYSAGKSSGFSEVLAPGWRMHCFPVSTTGLHAWQKAAAQYATQTSTFWRDEHELRAALKEYLKMLGGGVLWEGD